MGHTTAMRAERRVASPNAFNTNMARADLDHAEQDHQHRRADNGELDRRRASLPPFGHNALMLTAACMTKLNEVEVPSPTFGKTTPKSG